ncbi:MAG TPA: MotA/TolQ/ExbB proton channel family protein [Chitinivibrionales bacterium]
MLHSLASAFNAGGPFMWVILVVFAIACAVVVDRLIFYFIICRPNGVEMVSVIAQALNGSDAQKAKSIVAKRRAPLNMLMQTAIERYAAGMSFEDIQKGIDQAAIREMPRMTQRLNYLSLFANIGTLLGLLGTIVGLQEMFSSLAAVEAEKKAAMLASGIAQAMNATAFGLIVAVPCMVMYTTLYNKQQQITKDLDEAVVMLLDYLEKKLSAGKR